MSTRIMTPSTEYLVRVEAPHFVAGFVMRSDIVREAAPILAWTIGKPRDELRIYFKRKGWKVMIVPRVAA